MQPQRDSQGEPLPTGIRQHALSIGPLDTRTLEMDVPAAARGWAGSADALSASDKFES